MIPPNWDKMGALSMYLGHSIHIVGAMEAKPLHGIDINKDQYCRQLTTAG